tara:strand:- start:611 stop:865 length:255 start_codon:yes stop_codon:yes gene_type:complete
LDEKAKTIAVIIKNIPCHQDDQIEKLIIDEDQNAAKMEIPAETSYTLLCPTLCQHHSNTNNDVTRANKPKAPVSRKTSRNQLCG